MVSLQLQNYNYLTHEVNFLVLFPNEVSELNCEVGVGCKTETIFFVKF